jgi:hypothetical protein
MVRQTVIVATTQHRTAQSPMVSSHPSLLVVSFPPFRPLRSDKRFSIGGGAQVLQNDIDLGSESLSGAASERCSVTVSDHASGPITVTQSASATHATSWLRAKRGLCPRTVEVTLTIIFLDFVN